MPSVLPLFPLGTPDTQAILVSVTSSLFKSDEARFCTIVAGKIQNRQRVQADRVNVYNWHSSGTNDRSRVMLKKTDRVLRSTDRLMRTTDRVMRTTDRIYVKPTVSLSGTSNIKRRRIKKEQRVMPKKVWDIIQLTKIILKQTAPSGTINELDFHWLQME